MCDLKMLILSILWHLDEKKQSYTIGYKLQVIEYAKQYSNGAAKRILDHLQLRKESATS